MSAYVKYESLRNLKRYLKMEPAFEPHRPDVRVIRWGVIRDLGAHVLQSRASDADLCRPVRYFRNASELPVRPQIVLPYASLTNCRECGHRFVAFHQRTCGWVSCRRCVEIRTPPFTTLHWNNGFVLLGKGYSLRASFGQTSSPGFYWLSRQEFGSIRNDVLPLFRTFHH